MGGGDLNMKKSWHPLLMKNQERVWLEEKKALEEKKKLDQLRKELEEERQLQELQRMQEEQTGKKRADRLDWMYNTPATGGGPSQNDLEDYLLGKKRVDKMLIGDEHAKLGAAHKSFIAVQNANTARDTASKIREDPLFAIKQQEQAQYQALVSNPLRLKQIGMMMMRTRAGGGIHVGGRKVLAIVTDALVHDHHPLVEIDPETVTPDKRTIVEVRGAALAHPHPGRATTAAMTIGP